MMNWNSLMRLYAEWLIRKRAVVLVVLSVATVVLAVFAARIRLDNSLDQWLPQDHPYIQTTRQLERVFGGRNYTLIGIVPKNGDVYRPEILAKVRRIQAGIELMPQAVRRNVISVAAKKAKAINGTADGMEVHRLLERLPETPEEIARLRADLERNPVYLKAIVAPDGRALSILADFKLQAGESHYSGLYDAVEAIVSRERSPDVDIFMAGLPIDLRWLEKYNMQMPIYFGIAVLLILGIQWWSFRTAQGTFLPIVTALISVIWALGIMAARGQSMSILNTNTPILIMAVTAGHAIQILKRYYQEFRRLTVERQGRPDPQAINNAAIIESIVRVGPIMLLAGLIAVIVFLSLKLARTEMTQRFGDLAAMGILAGLVTELTFIPTLRSFLPPPRQGGAAEEGRGGMLDRALIWLSDALVGGRAVAILLVALAVLGLLGVGAWRLRQDATLKRYFPSDSQVRRDDAALNGLFGGTNSMTFLVEGKGDDALKDPRVLKAMAGLQRFLEGQPHVGKTQSIADLVRRMNRAMHGDDPAYDAVPDDRMAIAQYLLLYSLSGEPQDFDNLVDSGYKQGVIWTFIKTDSTAYASDLYAKAQRFIAEQFPADVTVRLGGSLAQNIASNDVVVQEKFSNMLQMGVVLFLVASLVLRSLVGGLFVVTPLVLVITANFGIMGWLRIPLDTGTALGTSLAIAIGADYELYLMFRMKEVLAQTRDLRAALRDSFLTAGKAIVFAAVSVAGGYSVLITSSFAFYQRFGAIVVVTMIVSALSTLVLLRAMMIVARPRFVFGEERDALFTQLSNRVEQAQP